jgi:hypothetical protein
VVGPLAKILVATTLTGTVAAPGNVLVPRAPNVAEFEDCVQDAIILDDGDQARIMCMQSFQIKKLRALNAPLPCPKCPPPPEPVNELTLEEIVGVGSAGAVIGGILTWVALSLVRR